MTTFAISFEDLFTVSRGSVATFYGPTTALNTALANTKRLQFDVAGVSVERLGLLIEKSATNPVLNSRMVQQVAGTINNFSLLAGATASVATGVPKIDGSLDVSMCIDNVVTNALVSQNVAIATGDQSKNAVLSCYMAVAPLLGANTGQLPALYASLTGTTPAIENGVVDLQRGLIRRAANQQAVNFISNGIEKGPLISGVQYYRVWMAFSLTNVTTFSAAIRPGFLSSTTQTTAQLFDGNGNASAASTGQVYTDQMQIDIGTGITYPSSPVITDIGATAVRQAEVFLCSGDRFSTNFKKTSSTVIIEAIADKQTAPENQFLFSINDGTLNNSIRAYRQATTNNLIFEVVNAGVSQASINLGSWGAGLRKKCAFTFSSTQFQAAFDGVASSVVTGTLPTAINRINLGSDGLSANQWGNVISSFVYDPNFYNGPQLVTATLP